jgi:hypothetical protein
MTAPRRPLGGWGLRTVCICKKREDQGGLAVANFPPAAGLEAAQGRVGASFHNLERPESKLGVEEKFDNVGHLSTSPAHAASSCTPSRLPTSKFPKVTIDKGLLHALRISDCGQSDDR